MKAALESEIERVLTMAIADWKRDPKVVPHITTLSTLNQLTADGKRYRKPTRKTVTNVLHASGVTGWYSKHKHDTWRTPFETRDHRGAEASLFYTPATRTIEWNVNDNNHEVDHAHGSWLWAALVSFCDDLTARGEWTRSTGGSIEGNDEYNVDAGGGEFTVKEWRKPPSKADQKRTERAVVAMARAGIPFSFRG